MALRLLQWGYCIEAIAMRPLKWGYCNKAIDFGYGYKALAKKALALMQQKKTHWIWTSGVTACKSFKTTALKWHLIKQISCKNKVWSNECKSGYFYRLTTSFLGAI